MIRSQASEVKFVRLRIRRELPMFGPSRTRPGEAPMTQTTGRFFDEFARLMNDAAGVANGVRREVETMVRTQAERILGDLDVVSREEFEAAKEMAAKARDENERLAARVAEIESKLGIRPKAGTD